MANGAANSVADAGLRSAGRRCRGGWHRRARGHTVERGRLSFSLRHGAAEVSVRKRAGMSSLNGKR